MQEYMVVNMYITNTIELSKLINMKSNETQHWNVSFNTLLPENINHNINIYSRVS